MKQLAEEKKKSGGKKSSSTKKKGAAGKEKDKKTSAGSEFAARQRNALILFVAAVLLAAIILIPGEMVWLWLHHAVRGLFSMFSLYWPLLLLFLGAVVMIGKPIKKVRYRTILVTAIVAALNACVYIFTYMGAADLTQTYEDGWSYSGGGVLGYMLGLPFLKLFGKTPAKILIILILVVLLMLLTDMSVKNIYNFFATIVKGIIRLYRRYKTSRRKRTYKKLSHSAPSDYFEDDEYETFDDDADETEDEDNFFDDDDEEEPAAVAEPPQEEKPKRSRKGRKKAEPEAVPELPQSPVFSDESAPPFDLDTEDSIDIDIDSPMDNSPDYDDGEYFEELIPPEQAEHDDDSLDEDDILSDFFSKDDDIQNDEASRIAAAISMSKKTPVKSDPSQRQYDTQKVRVEISSTRRRRHRDESSYPYPPTDLLDMPKAQNSLSADAELKENARKLIQTLESFSVGAKIVGYSRGPSITRYEIQPAPGVKISKITGLSDDIALNLAAEGVRIEAPIPGKAAIGIEIPNKSVSTVSIRELIDSSEFRRHKSKLACVLGKDVSGKIVLTDLAKMPHLLIAGTTGSGKSVCVNGILMSLLFRASSEEVKLILIDPKLVEFSKYKGIPHLLIPVVSDAKKAAGALNWAVKEMDQRYQEFSAYNVRDIDSYNRMVDKNLETMTEEEFEDTSEGEVVNGEFIPPKAKKRMPKIVIAIDELADLMMVAPSEVEESICRLAQKARAAGMHLVIATQRPSVNVITGVIKANIPSRISLKVASYVDSKTILDAGGGEKLIGRGDMLYSPVNFSKPIRVQGCYSSDEEIEAVTDYIKKHSSADYDENVSEEIERIASEELNAKGGKDTFNADDEELDPMLEDAIKLVCEMGEASTSMLQRRLRLGYARAGRIIDTMEQMGVVGPHEGSKSRKVLISYDSWLERQVTGSD